VVAWLAGEAVEELAHYRSSLNDKAIKSVSSGRYQQSVEMASRGTGGNIKSEIFKNVFASISMKAAISSLLSSRVEMAHCNKGIG
jgi:hypothetical protein